MDIEHGGSREERHVEHALGNEPSRLRPRRRLVDEPRGLRPAVERRQQQRQPLHHPPGCLVRHRIAPGNRVGAHEADRGQRAGEQVERHDEARGGQQLIEGDDAKQCERRHDGELEPQRNSPLQHREGGSGPQERHRSGAGERCGDPEKTRELAHYVVRARQVEGEQHVEPLVVELARDAGKRIERDDEHRREPHASRVKPDLEPAAFGDRELLDEKGGAQENRQRDERERRQARARRFEQRKAGDGRDARFHARMRSAKTVDSRSAASDR